MKATLQFDLPQENHEFHIATNAVHYHNALFHIRYNLAKEIKHMMESDEIRTKSQLIEKIFIRIDEICEDEHLKFE
jgi:hypothetical protein